MDPKGARQLSPRHEKYLRDRGVADGVGRLRGYRTVESKAELRRYGFDERQLVVPTLLIPIHGVDGQIKFYQHRPDTPRTVYTRIVKFETARGARLALDIHPGVRKELGNPRIPKLITEGAPKVDALLSIGLPAIGLMGVFGFRGKNEDGGLTALADWESIALNGCDIYLCFDSDVMVKQSVYLALDRVKRFLESRRAHVKIIYLPRPADDPAGKTGVDDFIAQQRAKGTEPKKIRDLLLKQLSSDGLRPPPVTGVDPDDPRPTIQISEGHIPEMVDRATEVLAAKAERLRLFQRGAEVVRVVVLTSEEAEAAKRRDRVYRPPGAVLLQRPSATQTLDLLERNATWYKMRAERNGGGQRPVLADCPQTVAQRYLGRVGEWRLPHLLGVIECPLVLPDGTVLRAPGYNPTTGLFLHSPIRWPEISPRLSRKAALAALEVLRQPFGEFPFDGRNRRGVCANEAVALAGVLTAIQRRMLDHAPLFAFDAPLQGTGKSLLVKVISTIAIGRLPTSTAVARDENERRKAIFALLREGHLIINLDNLTEVFSSTAVAQAITEAFYGDRVLGVSATERISTRVLICATGNNLRFGGDLTVRALTCRVDAKTERPDERTFRRKFLLEWVLEHRVELVMAAVTILSAWFAAGRPKQKVAPWGRFPQWGRDIREALIWLGCDDPCDKRDDTFTDDPERAAAGDIFRAWNRVFGDLRWITIGELIEVAYRNTDLRDLLLRVAPSRSDPQAIDAAKLGTWCADHRDRVIDGLHLVRKERSPKSKAARQWRVYATAARNATAGRKIRTWGD